MNICFNLSQNMHVLISNAKYFILGEKISELATTNIGILSYSVGDY